MPTTKQKSQSATTASSDPSASLTSNPREALWPNYNPPQDPVFSHGVGTELFTADGEVYLDFLSGIAVNSFGNAHPHLRKVLSEQADKLWHLSNVFRIPEAERLAQRLCANSFAERVFFANSGTEAVEAGIKAIRGYQASKGHNERHRIIGFNDSFHGRTIAALAAAGNPAHTKNFIPMDHGFDHVPWEDLQQLKATINTNTAGIILEPVQGEGGIRAVSPEFLAQVKALCDEHELVLMFDEVQCGLGRSGQLFAHQHYGITPDIMALAKGLGGGFPVGACLTTAAVGDAMVFGTHGSTFGGNPLAMAVANGVMDLVLAPGLQADVARKSEYLVAELNKLVGKYPQLIESVHGMGLMLGLKCIIPNSDLLSLLRTLHLIVGKSGSNMIRLLPPLNVTDAELDKAVALIDQALQQLQADASE